MPTKASHLAALQAGDPAADELRCLARPALLHDLDVRGVAPIETKMLDPRVYALADAREVGVVEESAGRIHRGIVEYDVPAAAVGLRVFVLVLAFPPIVDLGFVA